MSTYKFGGLAAMPIWFSSTLRGTQAEVSVTAKELKHPLSIRLGTSDHSVLSGVLGRHEYALPEGFSPKTIVDAGAYIGVTSAYFATRFPAARIIAIEPEPSNYRMLEKNSRPYPNIVTVHGALWNHSENITIQISGDDGKWGARVERKNGSVRAYTMPELITRFGLESIDLLKMDIECAEVEVLSSADDWIDRVGLLAIETHDRFRPGCTFALETVAHHFSARWRQGEAELLLR